jgi:WD40 repeat protein
METYYIINQKYLAEYDLKDVKIFDINSEKTLKLLFEIHEENKITNIEFNPSIDNIIIISYDNGICKIYNILNKNNKDFILFEGIDNCGIIRSKFNYLNPNIIASLNENSSIIIWNINEFPLLQIISSNKNNKIKNFKWSFFSEHLIEIKTREDIQLIEIETKEIKAQYKYKGKNFLFLDENNALIFKSDSIEKINIKEKKCVNKININDKYMPNIDLIQYNYLVIIIPSLKNLSIYDIRSLSEIKKSSFKDVDSYYFFYSSNQKITCHSFFEINKKKKYINIKVF